MPHTEQSTLAPGVAPHVAPPVLTMQGRPVSVDGVGNHSILLPTSGDSRSKGREHTILHHSAW
ncbi:MAG TPA: hypothetical protein VFA09_19760 [Ktedonobacteraceae bacterium]|nr:hypothetical protein [Ktedonobacteraceae bacterium]